MEDIESYRNAIDEIDSQILDLIYERLKIVHDVGKLKAKHISDFLYIDPEREGVMMKNLCEYAKLLGISEEIVHGIWRKLISSANLQEQNNLKIFIPDSISRDNLLKIYSEYPINQTFVFYKADDVLRLRSSASQIIAIELKNAYIDAYNYLTDNGYYIYSAINCGLNEKFCFFGQNKKFYNKEKDGNFVFINQDKRKVEILDFNAKNEVFDRDSQNMIYIGSYYSPFLRD